MATYVKLPPPRQLTQKESLESLEHWKSCFRNYFRRDCIFKPFLATDFIWNPNDAVYGLTSKDDMSASERKDALIDFLNNLAGFLPNSYLTAKLEKETTCLEDCWRIIEEHYNVNVTPETLLDFETLQKDPAENYRQFYERLLQHSKLHLAPVGAKIEKLENRTKDTMSISHMNLIALQWLRKIDPQLIQIIRTEYSTRLRSGEQLAALVPVIAPNIDSLRLRYGGANVSQVSQCGQEVESIPNVNRVHPKTNFQPKKNISRPYSNNAFCTGCFALGKQLKTYINFKHNPEQCPRQSVVVKMMQSEIEHCPAELAVQDIDYKDTGKPNIFQISLAPTQSLQTSSRDNEMPDATNMDGYPDFICKTSEIHFEENLSSHTLSQFIDCESHISEICPEIEKKWLGSVMKVRQESSPMVQAYINGLMCMPTIDEGSELNCIDADLALKASMEHIPTNCKAKSAGNMKMTIIGETKKNIVLTVHHPSAMVTWNLGKCIVVQNLGVQILIGEPAKLDNQIVTKPHLKVVESKDDDGNKVIIPYFSWKDKERSLLKAVQSVTIFPDEVINHPVPTHLCLEKEIAITPTREAPVNFVEAGILKVRNGEIELRNCTNKPVFVKKNSCIADICAVNKISTQSMDESHLQRPKILVEETGEQILQG